MKPKWDIAREAFQCSRRGETIGQGEAFRVSRIPNRNGICEDCSVALDGEAAPDTITPRTFMDELRDDLVQLPPKPERRFLQPQPGRQPSFDPRGQTSRQRHGVVAAVRNTTKTDWHDLRKQDWARRAAGERDDE